MQVISVVLFLLLARWLAVCWMGLTASSQPGCRAAKARRCCSPFTIWPNFFPNR